MRCIEVYVRTKKQILRQYTTPPVWDGYQHHACMSKEVTEYEKTLPETDSYMLEIVKQLAKENGVEVKIYDVSTFIGKLRAMRHGINKTPAVVIGKEKIENINVEVLRSKLKHQ